MSGENQKFLNLELDEYPNSSNADKNYKLNNANDTSEDVYRPTFNEATMKVEALKVDLKKEDPVFLYATAFTADLLIFAVGIGFSWTSPVLPKLDGPESPLGYPVNMSQKSWIATFLCIGAAVGPLVAGKMADSLGRKNTLICLAFPMLIAFFTLAFATNLYLYYLARFLHGISVGSSLAVLPMYLAEVTENHNRGKFSGIMAIFITSGILYPFVVGPMFDIQTFCLTCTFPLFIFLIIFYLFMPETPHFLLSVNNKNAAQEALMALRNKASHEVQKELAELSQSVQDHSGEGGGLKDLLSSSRLRKGFIISAGLVIIQQLSGINAVLGYMHSIFKATGTSIPSNISTVVIGVVQVLSTFLTAAVVDRMGRKILLLASTTGSAASIVLLGTYFFLKGHKFNIAFLWWLPIASLMVLIIAFNIGIGPLPWTIMAEIFPSHVKATAASLTSSICFFTSAGIMLAYPQVSEIIGMDGCFWMFGGFLSIGIVFIYLIVPETKGKSLDQIQEMLGGRSSKA